MSALGELRLNEISEEFAHVDLIALTSTGERASEQVSTRSACKFHFAIHSGFVPSRHCNKSCGIILMVRKRKFRAKHVIDTPAVPAQLRGRVALHRLRSGRFDIVIPITYFPPRPSARRANRESVEPESHKRYQHTVDTMCSWMEQVLNWTPRRASLFWGFDLSDSLGWRRKSGGQVLVVSRSLGKYCNAEQHYASDRVLEVMEKYAIRAVSTDFATGPTYVGLVSASCIDFIATFEWQAKDVQMCVPLVRSNVRLKLIRKQGARDHIPLLLKVDYTFDMSHSRTEQTAWDFDRLAQALRRGQGVPEFINELEREFAEGPDYHDLCVAAPAPDDAWARWITTVYAVAERHFGRQPASDPKAREYAAARSKLLADRRRLREVEGDDTHVCMELARASRRLRRLRRSRLEETTSALEEAWRSRRHAEVWRLAHLLAGKCGGSKRRRFNLADDFVPRRDEVQQYFSLPGPEGGLRAVPVEFAEYQQARLEGLPPPPTFGSDNFLHVEEGRDDLEAITTPLEKAPRGKAAPAHSVPCEILMLVLDPNRKFDGTHRKPRR